MDEGPLVNSDNVHRDHIQYIYIEIYIGCHGNKNPDILEKCNHGEWSRQKVSHASVRQEV